MDGLTEVQNGITRLSVWIDAPSAAQDPLAQLLLRVGKLTEESGEVWDALIGAIGQNPRKGVYKSWDDVDKELLDCIVTAWGALEHRHGNTGVVADKLLTFVRGLLDRAGLEPAVRAPARPPVTEGEFVRVLVWEPTDRSSGYAPATPFEGEIGYVGTKLYAGQPSIYWRDDGQLASCFAWSWERLDG